MDNSRFLSSTVILIGLAAISLVAGCFVPAYYEWTGSDQSRPSVWLWAGPLGIAVIALVACCTLPWLKFGDLNSEPRSAPFQFPLRAMLALTGMIAVATAIGSRYPMSISFLVYAAAVAVAIWNGYRRRSDRLPILVLFACLLLPFAWVMTHDTHSGWMPEILLMSLSLPGLLPATFLASASGTNLQDAGWIATLVVATQIVVGVGVIRIGRKPAIAYLVAILLVSTTSSLIFNAMLRI